MPFDFSKGQPVQNTPPSSGGGFDFSRGEVVSAGTPSTDIKTSGGDLVVGGPVAKIARFVGDEVATGKGGDTSKLPLGTRTIGSIFQSTLGSKGALGFGKGLVQSIFSGQTRREGVAMDVARRDSADLAMELITKAKGETDQTKKSKLLSQARDLISQTENLATAKEARISEMGGTADEVKNRVISSGLNTALTGATGVAGGLGSGQVVSKVLPKAISTFGRSVVPRAIEGATIGAGFKTAENVSSGAPVTEGLGEAALFGAAIPVVGTGLSKIREAFGEGLKSMSRNLELSNLRLTPTQQRQFKNKLQPVADFITKEKISGNPAQRTQRATELYEEAENQLQDFLATQKKEGNFILKNEILSKLERMKRSLAKDSSVAPAVRKQVQDAIDNINAQYGKKIPVDRLNTLKRSTYKNAYNAAGGKIIDGVEHSIADVYRKAIETATKGLKINGKDIAAFNKNYGIIINAKKLLEIAEGRKQVSTVERLLADLIGYGTLGPLAPVATEAILPSFATRGKAAAARGASALSESLAQPSAIRRLVPSVTQKITGK